jgi:hypothetical protein
MDLTQLVSSTDSQLLVPITEAEPSSPATEIIQWSQTQGYREESSLPIQTFQYISQDATQYSSTASQSLITGRGRRILQEPEHRELMIYVFEHRDQYVDWNYTWKRFWNNLSVFIKEQFDKEVRQPECILKRLVALRQAQWRGEAIASGEAILDTTLKQVLDEWIEFTDDLERLRAEESQNRTTEQQLNRQIAAQERDNMITRQMDCQTDEEDARDSNKEVSMANTLNPLLLPTPGPSSSVSQASSGVRKRKRTTNSNT